MLERTTALRQPADALGPRAHRTIARIIDATREVFLTRGYAGTTVDEIARVAGVSRASFYTYFATKREVLLTVGEESAQRSMALIEQLPDAGPTHRGLADWVGRYFDHLDVHGSFAFAWTQAAHEDEAIRVAGMRRHLALCRRLGNLLAGTAGRTPADPAPLGLLASAALERSWDYQQLYADTIERKAIVAQVTATLWAGARQTAPA
ncbi:MAG: TetR/AcrR family transcriptional regulator [Ilumatobacteraceae bacterium]